MTASMNGLLPTEAVNIAPTGAAPLRPRDAATIILLDASGREAKVLMGKRHASHVFMPGKYVFPGGRVEAADGRMNIFGGYADHVERRLTARVSRPTHARTRAYGLAAIRELAEETGFLFGSREAGAPRAAAPIWAPFEQAGVFPALDGLSFIARAITPPGRTRRYDTRFFAADAGQVAMQAANTVGPDGELTELVWVTLADARTLDLPRITGAVLTELEARLDTGLDRDSPVPFFYARGNMFRREEL